VKIFTVDSFTGKAFAGNPAAVCLLEAPAEVPWMSDVAAEMNLSETAFVSPRSDGGFDLRWFTPSVEVDLCGHATLASAHILWETDRIPADMEVRFHTRSGWLTCHRRSDRIEMDFPLRPVKEVDPPDGLLEALGVDAVAVFESAVSYLIELGSEDEVRACTPDFVRMNAIPDSWTCITSVAATPGFDFVSRFFAPAGGIDEDPVTGSSHCALADYWSKRSGRTDFRAFQCSKRGGVVFARIEGDRVMLGGQAVTVLRGELV
jgi:PhzF family phenazine biosynthesis protein